METDLIWGLVNYKNTNEKRVKQALTKWVEDANQPGFNMLYRVGEYILEIVGATVIHLCYILVSWTIIISVYLCTH